MIDCVCPLQAGPHAAQPTLREQIAVQLLGRLALRKNELRLLKVGDFDLTQGTFIVHGKGEKVS
jgi:hypothetical protein